MARRNKMPFKNPIPPPPKPHIHESNKPNGSIIGNIGTGMSIGAGSAMGHKVVESIFGSRSNDVVTDNSELLNNQKIYQRKLIQMQTSICDDIRYAYNSCITNGKDCSELSELMVKMKC